MQERYGSVANIYGVSNDVMEKIINFMYTGTIKLTEDNVMEILVTSDYLQMDGEFLCIWVMAISAFALF